MKKPVVKFSLSCDEVIIDVNHKISLIGIFENIESPSFPTKHPKCALVTRWGEGKGKFTVQIRLLDPSKEKIIAESKPFKAIFEDETHRHNDTLYLGTTEFDTPGVYWIESLLNGEAVHYEPLNLIQKA